jgi:DNA topoisomerase-2
MSKLLQEKHDYNIEGIEKYLKLYSIQSNTNMHLFNEKEQLRKYNNVYDIIDAYYAIRHDYYAQRKAYIIVKLDKELKTLTSKARFIQYNLDDTIDLRKKSKEEIVTILTNFKFDLGENGDFNYLIKMPMDSVSKENVEKLMKEHEQKKSELETIKAQTLEEMWLTELEELKIAYNDFLKLPNKTDKVEESTKKMKKK